MGTCKVRNEIETKRNETKYTETKSTETKRNPPKRNETKRNPPKRNESAQWFMLNLALKRNWLCEYNMMKYCLRNISTELC